MAERDDDFLDHGGEEFNVDSDEFSIPEDADSGDDFLDDNSDFELSEDDIIDESSSEADHFDFLDDELGDEDSGNQDSSEDDVPTLEEHGEFSGEETEEEESGYGETDEYDEYLEGEEHEGDASLGWKAWTGLALGVVLTMGGLTYYVMPPSTSSNEQVAGNTRQESLPEPPPAPPKSQSANQQTPPPAPQSSGQGAPVSVSPFPDDGTSTGNSANRETGADQVTADQRAADQLRAEMAKQQGQIAQAETSTPTRAFDTTSAQAPAQTASSGFGGSNSGGSGNGGGFDSGNQGGTPEASTLAADDSEYRTAPINRGSETQQAREAGYTAMIEDQRRAFALLMKATQGNGEQLSQMENKLDNFQRKTSKNVNDLDRRVEKLEKMMQQRPAVTKQAVRPTEKAATQSEGQTKKGPEYSVPKSPSEIKDMQRTLNAHNYRAGTVDGLLGPQTREAIKRLQKEHGLPVNSWLNAETLAALADPKIYSGTYPKPKKKAPSKPAKVAPDEQWYVRGVTPTKAVVYRPDGLSYAVKVGSEIPGMGQVTQLDTEKLHVVTAKGVITRR